MLCAARFKSKLLSCCGLRTGSTGRQGDDDDDSYYERIYWMVEYVDHLRAAKKRGTLSIPCEFRYHTNLKTKIMWFMLTVLCSLYFCMHKTCIRQTDLTWQYRQFGLAVKELLKYRATYWLLVEAYELSQTECHYLVIQPNWTGFPASTELKSLGLFVLNM